MKLVDARKHRKEVKKLYTTAFPKEERAPFSLLMSRVNNGRDSFYAVEDDGEFVGLVYTIRKDKLVYIFFLAVVAEEIRKLTESSSQSVLNTKTLIEASIKEVEVGNEITERTAESLKKVVEILDEVRHETEATVRLSEEQAEAMRGIESEISQITDVVQSNSATAEQSSAVCEELTAQAINLNDLVEEFSI